ncbi:MAG: MFS transporter [Candidatus Bathyarchaeota archaeon]|nr:MAG: MFS transporter [Candidatus Bathyarchaeota archaeon]
MWFTNAIGQFRDFLRQEFSFITGNYRILVFSWMIMDIAFEMPASNFQYYVEALGGPPVALGLIGLGNFLALAIVAFPGGYLADKFGRRWLISTMTFAIALSFLFFALAPSWEFVLFGSIIGSLCLIYQPALFAMVQDSLPPERRGMGSSIIQLIHGTFNTPGPVIAIFIFGWFGKVTGQRVIYFLMTGLFLAAAVLRLRLKETVTDGKPIRLSYFISSYPKAVRESFGVWKVLPRTVLWLFLVRTFVMFGMSLTNVINALYARDVLGIPEGQWYFVHIPLLVTMVVASLPIGKMVDKVGRKVPIVLGLCALSVGTMVFAFGDFLMVLISMSLFGIAFMMVMSGVMALSADLIEPKNRGKVIGFNNFVGYIVMGIGMLIGGGLYESMLPQAPFFTRLGFTLVALFVVLLLVHEPKKTVEAVTSLQNS